MFRLKPQFEMVAGPGFEPAAANSQQHDGRHPAACKFLCSAIAETTIEALRAQGPDSID
jgi:hypothetical protein